MTAATITLVERIPAWVAANPGATVNDIIAAMDCSQKTIRWRLTQLHTAGKLFRAGRLHSSHYFADRASAEAAHDGVVRDQVEAARQNRLVRQRVYWHAKEAAKPPAAKKTGSPKFAAVDTEILRLAGDSDGLSPRPLLIYDRKAVYRRIVRLHKIGLLFVGSLGHKSKRYFTDIRQAKAWQESKMTISSVRASKVHPRGLAANAQVIERHVEVQKITHQADHRYAVTGPFERTITSDWMLRRQGVDIRAVIGVTP